MMSAAMPPLCQHVRGEDGHARLIPITDVCGHLSTDRRISLRKPSSIGRLFHNSIVSAVPAQSSQAGPVRSVLAHPSGSTLLEPQNGQGRRSVIAHPDLCSKTPYHFIPLPPGSDA